MKPHNRSDTFEPTTAVLCVIFTLFVCQLWLLMATVEATLGGDKSIAVPALITSMVCLGVNLWLFQFISKPARADQKAPSSPTPNTAGPVRFLSRPTLPTTGTRAEFRVGSL